MVFCIDLYIVKVDKTHTNIVQDILEKNRLSARTVKMLKYTNIHNL